MSSNAPALQPKPEDEPPPSWNPLPSFLYSLHHEHPKLAQSLESSTTRSNRLIGGKFVHTQVRTVADGGR